ncbi:MAG TPA: BamA/TamA family outer membrane protein [Chitinophagaceae bacterium]|nr:BamA/TamA family outer membrane protein [Chitinophagaceae bacterium]
MMQRVNIFLIVWLTLLGLTSTGQEGYGLRYHVLDKDTSLAPESLGLKSVFPSQNDCFLYMEKLLNQQRAKGFISFSIDSVRYDSTQAEVWIFMGKLYRWKNVALKETDAAALNALGYTERVFSGKVVDLNKVYQFQEKALVYMENNGYPFASLRIDSLVIEEDEVSGRWVLDKGPHYKIDSITVTGNAKISNYYLQQYLEIPKGSYYKKEKLDAVSRRLMELPFLKETRPWDMTMVGTGSALNLYLDSKRSSQINALVGLLPSNPQLGGKLLITGEANLNLKNALGGGETIGANWQQLQVKSPRLNLLFQQPYIFKSKFGFDFNFDLFKKDSSFLNLNLLIGLQYMVSQRQQGRLFFQGFKTNLINVDTNQIKATKTLPEFLDISTNNLGVDYQYNNTDYRLNPRKGNELYLLFSGGLRTIRKNNTITSLTTDASGKPYDFESLYDTLKMKTYLLKLRLNGAHYFRTGRQSTLRTAVNAGLVQTENAFKNEVFQIGGYKLMRGFDEESIYATQYAVGTVEYRYLIGINAYMFAFTDIGWARNNTFTELESHFYIGSGFGIALETKAGILNLSYAVGKRDDGQFNLRQSKIHFGFVSIF